MLPRPVKHFIVTSHTLITRRTPSMLTAYRLRQLIHYDPLTGAFTHPTTGANLYIPAQSNPAKPATLAVPELKPYNLCRLAGLYMKRKPVTHALGLRDDDPNNYKWANIGPRFGSNTLTKGLRGVQPWKGGFAAVWAVGGTLYKAGPFDTPEEANAHYLSIKGPYA